MYDLVCLGASWGGLQALGRILADLPEEFRQEVTTALKYERGLVVKASAALAIVILVVLIRMLFLG